MSLKSRSSPYIAKKTLKAENWVLKNPGESWRPKVRAQPHSQKKFCLSLWAVNAFFHRTPHWEMVSPVEIRNPVPVHSTGSQITAYIALVTLHLGDLRISHLSQKNQVTFFWPLQKHGGEEPKTPWRAWAPSVRPRNSKNTAFLYSDVL